MNGSIDLTTNDFAAPFFSEEMNKIINYEAALLEQRIQRRTKNLFFSFFALTNKRKYPKLQAHEIISAEFKKYITTPQEEAKFIKAYLCSKAHYDLFLFSEDYVFIRHVAGLTILELSSITDITASKTRMGCATITFFTPNPIRLDFLMVNYSSSNDRFGARKIYTFESRLDMSLPYLYNSHLAQDLKFITENIVLRKFPDHIDGYIPKENPNPDEACEAIKTQLAGFTRREIKRHIYTENTATGAKFILGIIVAFVLSFMAKPKFLPEDAPLWMLKYASFILTLIGIALIAVYILWKEYAGKKEKRVKRAALSEAGKEYMDKKNVEIIKTASTRLHLSSADFCNEYNNATIIKINDYFEARTNDKFLFFRILGNVVGYKKENIQALTYVRNFNYLANARKGKNHSFKYNYPLVIIHKTGIVEGYSFEQKPYIPYEEGKIFISGSAGTTGLPIIDDPNIIGSKPMTEICTDSL